MSASTSSSKRARSQTFDDAEWFWLEMGKSYRGAYEEHHIYNEVFLKDGLIGRPSRDGSQVSILECCRAEFYRTQVVNPFAENVEYMLTGTERVDGNLCVALDKPSAYFVFTHQWYYNAADMLLVEYPKVQEFVDPGGTCLRIPHPEIWFTTHFVTTVDYGVYKPDACIRIRVRVIWIDAMEYARMQLTRRPIRGYQEG